MKKALIIGGIALLALTACESEDEGIGDAVETPVTVATTEPAPAPTAAPTTAAPAPPPAPAPSIDTGWNDTDRFLSREEHAGAQIVMDSEGMGWFWSDYDIEAPFTPIICDMAEFDGIDALFNWSLDTFGDIAEPEVIGGWVGVHMAAGCGDVAEDLGLF